MREFTGLAKAISDPHRARVVMLLRGGELCLCQIIELLGLAPSTVSKHLTILHQAQLVESRKDGRWIYYRLPGKDTPADVRGCLRWMTACLEGEREVVADAKRLKAVRRMKVSELCCRYYRSEGKK